MATYTDRLTAVDIDSKEEIFRQFQIAKERLDTISKGPSKEVKKRKTTQNMLARGTLQNG